MRCIAQISDLHFGTEDPVIVEALLADLDRTDPSFIVISGDLTQRARGSQYAAAHDFLARLKRRYIVIPGNHDIPLYDIFRRFFAPMHRYRKYITPDLNPFFEDRELAILGLNTARSLTWKSGRISSEQIERIRNTIGNVGPERFKIVITHHPFIPPPGEPESGIDLVGRAREALEVLDTAGVDLLLAGHLHHGYSGDVRSYYPATKRSIIVVQAGTAVSRRIRSEPNAYNLLTLDKETIQIEVRLWQNQTFSPSKQTLYRLKNKEWRVQ